MQEPGSHSAGAPLNRWVRKFVTVVEDVVTEVGREPDRPVRKVAVGAVIANPWAGRGYVDDLGPEVRERMPHVSRALVSRVLTELGGADRLEAFGKGAIVGLDGDLEHAGAVIHTPHFGDVYRQMAEAESIIAFADHRAAAGTSLVIPMWHKTTAARRSHYQTVEFRVPDAPAADEILVIAAGSSGSRPHPRIGDRSTDAADATVAAA